MTLPPRLKKLLYPGPLWVAVLVILGGGALYLTFFRSLEDTPFAYVSYVLSAYALVTACAFVGRDLRKNLRAAVHGNPFLHRYLTDLPFKTHVSLDLSLAVNLAFAAVKLAFGVRFRSVWFGTLAVYYILLSLLRFLLLHFVSRRGIGAEVAAECRRCRLCGAVLLGMNFVLAGVVILVVWENQTFSYPGYLIYAVALYAFYNIITAVADLVRYRRYDSPVMSASKAVKLVTALVSMLALETAMLTQFDQVRGPAFQRRMTALTGGCVCLLVSVIALGMIVRSTRRLRALGQSPAEP